MTRCRIRFAFGLLLLGLWVLGSAVGATNQPLPKGLMLNLDFQNVTDGLIPSKTLYPLHVPLGKLKTGVVNHRKTLIVEKGQGLDIPHSSLLDPDGSIWVASVQVLAIADGIILSQGNDKSGYVIYIKGGIVHATILSGPTAVTLREQAGRGFGNVLNQRVTIDLKIHKASALLVVNRNRVALVSLQQPLEGQHQWIRLGSQLSLPSPLKRNPTATKAGFTGHITSLKILRQ
jgi:hypothetical protein